MQFRVGDIVRMNKEQINHPWYTEEDVMVIKIKGEVLKTDRSFQGSNSSSIHYSRMCLIKSVRQRKLEKLNETFTSDN